MAFNTSKLSEYIDEMSSQLTLELVNSPSTIASGIEVQLGKKYNYKLNSLSNDVFLQADSCGWEASGTTTFGQAEIEVDGIKLNESICPIDL
jgi:hypothetical protein